MENLELIFNDIKSRDIDIILNWLSFNKTNVESSHFFIDGMDKEYDDITDFSAYFENIGTCNLVVKNLDIGVTIEKAIIIISFDKTFGDMTVNFSENEWGSQEQSNEEKIFLLSEKINNIIDKINYKFIYFGYEPATDEDMRLFCIGKNMKN